jgi:hypothetical protein
MFFKGVGALFVPFSPPIVAEALKPWNRHQDDNWSFTNDVYQRLGYTLVGNTATIPPKPDPYAR